jgi:hypothetical protein
MEAILDGELDDITEALILHSQAVARGEGGRAGDPSQELGS